LNDQDLSVKLKPNDISQGILSIHCLQQVTAPFIPFLSERKRKRSNPSQKKKKAMKGKSPLNHPPFIPLSLFFPSKNEKKKRQATPENEERAQNDV